MDAHEHVLGALDLAADERHVLLAGHRLAKGDGAELPVARGQRHRGHALDEALVAAPVLDQVGDGDQLQPVPLAVGHEVAHAGHRPVVVHDLAHDAGRDEPGEARQVDGGLGLAGPLEDTAGARLQRLDVTRMDHVRRGLGGVDRHLDRVRAVVRRDARGDAFPRFDRVHEGGAERRLVALRHGAQVELVAALLGEAEADQAAPVGGHEGDRLGRGELRRDREVALVLAVLVVHDDDEAAVPDLLDRLLDGRERRQLRDGHRLGAHAVEL